MQWTSINESFNACLHREVPKSTRVKSFEAYKLRAAVFFVKWTSFRMNDLSSDNITTVRNYLQQKQADGDISSVVVERYLMWLNDNDKETLHVRLCRDVLLSPM